MDAQDLREMLRVFDDLPDPRRHNHRYLLSDIILLAVSAVMCGCEGWQDIEDWTDSAFGFLQPLMKKPELGTPSADTFRRVFARLSPEGFERCFVAWTQGLKTSTSTKTPDSQEASDSGGSIAIDGKCLRRSYTHAWANNPLHLVSAFATESQLILGQLKVESKENEIVAIPHLLESLDVSRSTVSIDAMGCQKGIAGKIIQGKGDYVLALKENQPSLYQSVKNLLDEAILEGFKGLRHDRFEETTGDHGRIETRKVWVTDDLRWIKPAKDWVGLRQIVVVDRRREVTGGKVSTQRSYYIASHRKLDASRTAGVIRSHWSIENQVHWVLDMSFNEDQSRIRREDGPENFARLRRMVLNKLRAYVDPSGKKRSLRMKRKLCGWNFGYFMQVLAA
jgi:predicted transposase YbfD/YdcC